MREGPGRAAASCCDARRRTPTAAHPPGEDDLVDDFARADAAVPTFHAVRALLRDVARNPEWAYVREAPAWQGRRVATWSALL